MRLLAGLVSLVVLSLPAQDTRLQKENALGEQLEREFRQKQNTTRINAPALQEYVNRVGERLAAQIPDSRSPYRFEVIAQDSGGDAHEPVAFPAGHVFVFAPLILAAQNEAEFACMLADAMAVLESQKLRNGPVWIGGSGALPVVIQQQADADAVKIASSAGFDPAALGRYIARAYQSAARLAALEKVFQRLPPRTYAESGDFARVQEELRRASPQGTRRAPSLLQK
jgi:predicted Zn-dependent protease